MLGVGKHVVEAYLIHRELTGIHELKLKAKDVGGGSPKTLYQPLAYSEADQCRVLKLTSSMQSYKGHATAHPNTISVEKLSGHPPR